MSDWIFGCGEHELSVFPKPDDYNDLTLFERADYVVINDTRYVRERRCRIEEVGYMVQQCSECSETFSIYDSILDLPNYCPMCGAKVVSE